MTISTCIAFLCMMSALIKCASDSKAGAVAELQKGLEDTPKANWKNSKTAQDEWRAFTQMC